MKLFHLVISSSATIFLYLILSATWGASGSLDYEELIAYQSRLESSIAQLEQDQQKMATDLERLRNDPSRLRQEAHSIGMIGSDEIRIKVPVDLPRETELPSANIADKPAERALAKPLISGVSLSLGVIILLILTLFDLESTLRGKPVDRRRAYRHQGIRVQTASRE